MVLWVGGSMERQFNGAIGMQDRYWVCFGVNVSIVLPWNVRANRGCVTPQILGRLATAPVDAVPGFQNLRYVASGIDRRVFT